MIKNAIITLAIVGGSFIALNAAITSYQKTDHEVVAEGGIDFFTGSWDETLAEAKKQNKLIYFHGYTTWCGPCNKMKQKVYTDPSVGEYFNEHFVNVKVDMEKGEGITLANKYGITAYPTLLFIDKTGAVVKRTKGYHNSNQLIGLAKQVLSK